MAAVPGRRYTFEQVFPEQLGFGQLDRIHAVKAGAAQTLPRHVGRRDHAFERDVRERVRAERAADLPDTQAVRDQLSAAREVDTEEARPLHRRTGDPYMNLRCASLTQHPDQSALRVSANNRVVDDHQPLPLDDPAQGIELEPDPEL